MRKLCAGLMLASLLFAPTEDAGIASGEQRRPSIMLDQFLPLDLTEVASLGFQLGLSVETRLVRGRSEFAGMTGAIVNASREEAVLIALQDFVTKGGRALVLSTGEASRLVLEERFSLSVASAGLGLRISGSSLGCVPTWASYETTLAHEAFVTHFFVPGPEFSGLCTVEDAETGRGRIIAARRRLGAGEVIFAVIPRIRSTRYINHQFPIEDESLHLLENELAARATLNWLAGR